MTTKNSVTIGKTTFSLLTENLLRLQFGAVDNRPSMRVMTRPEAIPFADIIQEGDTTTLLSDRLTIRYEGDEPFSTANLSIDWQSGDMQGTWTPGTTDLQNMGGTVFSMDNIGKGLTPSGVHPAGVDENEVEAVNLYNPWYFNQLVFDDLRKRFGGDYPRSILHAGQLIDMHWDDLSPKTRAIISHYKRYTPGIISRNGYFLLNDSQTARFDPETNRLVGTPPDGAQDWYFFAYGRDYAQAFKDFTTLCGKIPMLPRWALGNWYSFWDDIDEAEVKNRVALHEEHDLPIDVFVWDMQWHTPSHWCGFEWHPELYPDPKGLLDWMHEKGLVVPLNLHLAGVPLDEKHLPAIAKEIGEDLQERIDDFEAAPLSTASWQVSHSVDDVFAYDFNKPDHAQAVFEHLIAPLYDDGVDFFWLDGQNGETEGVNNQMWTNHLFYTDMQKRFPNKRALVLSRYGGIGSHRYPVGFGGDTITEWAILQSEIDMTARAGNVGQAYWSHDIGGHMHAYHLSPHGMTMDTELYVRWVQFGALSPINRLHSTFGLKREVWEYGPRPLAIMRDALQLRMSLLPYFYHLSHEAHEQGLPICRPLYIHYPEDGAAHDCVDQYLLGDRLLVAPVIASGSVRTVYLPEGYWWSWMPEVTHAGASSRLFRGSSTWTVAPDMDEIPVYAKAGTLLPRQPITQRAGVGVPETLILEVYPNAPGTTAEDVFDLYEDDGQSMAHQDGAYSILPLRLEASDATISISAEPIQGQFAGMPTQRTFEIQVRFCQKPSVVELDGKAMAADRWQWQEDEQLLVINTGQKSVADGWQVTVQFV
jgi:alpha-glucosidase (family GH31 glycosyl hydrolase)